MLETFSVSKVRRVGGFIQKEKKEQTFSSIGRYSLEALFLPLLIRHAKLEGSTTDHADVNYDVIKGPCQCHDSGYLMKAGLTGNEKTAGMIFLFLSH